MSNLAERLKTARKSAGLTQAQLGEKIGVSQNTIQKIESGGDTKHIVTLAKVLNVNANWLQTGEGVMIGANNQISNSHITNTVTYGESSIYQNKNSLSEDEIIVIDVLDIQASAGTGAINGEAVQIISQLRYVPEQFYQYYSGINPSVTRVINVKGDSMRPTFEPGDLLFVDISVTAFNGDGIYVFTYDDSLFVKRVQKIGKSYLIISDNKDGNYVNWEIKPEEQEQVYFHGKVKVHQSQRLNYLG